MGSIRTDYDRIAKKIGPEIMLGDPIVVNCLQDLRVERFRSIEDVLVGCIKTLSAAKEAALDRAIKAVSRSMPSQIIVVTEERFEELQKEIGA